jgi:hypothetical protein
MLLSWCQGRRRPRPADAVPARSRAAAEIQPLEVRRMLALTLGVDGAGRLHSVEAVDFAQTG